MVRSVTVVLALALLVPSPSMAQLSTASTAGQTARVYITGEVTRPGVYPLVAGMTIADLLAASGGLPPSADRTRLLLVSGTQLRKDGQPIAYFVNCGELMKGMNLAKNLVELRAGDVVIVRPETGLTVAELREKVAAEMAKR